MKFSIFNFQFSIISALIYLFVAAAPAFAQAATLSLSPSTGTFNRSCTFNLDVNLNTGGAQTDGTDAILMYDASRFSTTTQNIAPNTTVYPEFPGSNVDEAAGKITISGLASVSTPFSGSGKLATITFTVKEAAPTGATQITFDYDSADKAKTTDSNVVQRDTVADILNSVVNGSYTIGTGTCGAAPAPSVLPKTGAPGIGTPSGAVAPVVTPFPSQNKLPPGGTPELTFTLAIVGSVLTVLGILGLALL